MYKNILIIGAETNFGKQLTSYLLSQNYYVAVFVANRNKWDEKNENLELIQGDVLDYYDLKYAVSGHQVVISVLDYKNYKAGEISIILQNLLNAISANFVDKYISVVPIGSGQTKSITSLLFKVISTLKFMKPMLNEYSIQEKQLNKTNIDYTIIQVGKIYNSTKTNLIIKTILPSELRNRIQFNSYKISSSFLCYALNAIMNNPGYKGKTVIVTPGNV